MPLIDVLISRRLDAELTLIELDERIDRTELLRQGFAALMAHSQAKKAGFPHMGFATDPDKLDVRLTGILGST